MFDQLFRDRVKAFLDSAEGRSFLSSLLVEQALREDLDPILNEARSVLASDIELRSTEVHENLTGEANKITQELKDIFVAQRKDIKKHLTQARSAIENNLNEYQVLITDITKEILNRIISTCLYDLLKQEVREFIRARPIQDSLTNRQIAAANGISLRAAKRLKKSGAGSAHLYSSA